jgi:hypothetical protein
MEAVTLKAILSEAHGLKLVEAEYRPDDDRELTVYLGKPGSSMAISHVLGVRLHPAYVEIRSRDGGTLYTGYESAQAVACREKSSPGGKRNVGF